ncbi:MAG TPA: EF-hand domain-containing protein [Steroidobacteraceae bacterium]|nr:EF-hand domain-containing protein [Steroidobacteraceae bacterium]
MKASNLFAVGTAAVLLPLAAAFAQSPEQTPTPDATQQPSSAPQSAPDSQSQSDTSAQGKGATFESLDANSDGKISKDEAEANATVKAQFSKYDVNGDGFIERAEVGQANESTTPPQQ